MCQRATRRSGAFNLTIDGFSLIELLFTITILGILTHFTFTTYQQGILTSRLTTLSDRLEAVLYYAQSEAIYRHVPVTLCKSAEGIHCGGTWQAGWLLFRNRYMPSPKPEQRLRIYPRLNAGEFILWRGAGGREYLTFHEDGSVRGYNGRFIVCVKVLNKTQGRFITISPTGRIRNERLLDQQACFNQV